MNLNYLAKVVSQYLPPEYPYDVVGGARNVKQADFDRQNRCGACCRSKYIFYVAENYTCTNTITNSNITILRYITCIKYIETCTKR